jgi:hypothetical protein
MYGEDVENGEKKYENVWTGPGVVAARRSEMQFIDAYTTLSGAECDSFLVFFTIYHYRPGKPRARHKAMASCASFVPMHCSSLAFEVFFCSLGVSISIIRQEMRLLLLHATRARAVLSGLTLFLVLTRSLNESQTFPLYNHSQSVGQSSNSQHKSR